MFIRVDFKSIRFMLKFKKKINKIAADTFRGQVLNGNGYLNGKILQP